LQSRAGRDPPLHIHIFMQKQIQWVDLIAWDPVQKKGTMCARVLFRDEKIQFQGELALVSELKDGLTTYPDAQLVYPEDGMKFLEAVAASFRSPSLLATDIQSADEPSPFGDRAMTFKQE